MRFWSNATTTENKEEPTCPKHNNSCVACHVICHVWTKQRRCKKNRIIMLDRLGEALYNAFRGASRWQKMQAQSSKIAGDVESGTRARSLVPVKLCSCTLAAEGGASLPKGRWHYWGWWLVSALFQQFNCSLYIFFLSLLKVSPPILLNNWNLTYCIWCILSGHFSAI